jgi:hypothetical protein
MREDEYFVLIISLFHEVNVILNGFTPNISSLAGQISIVFP